MIKNNLTAFVIAAMLLSTQACGNKNENDEKNADEEKTEVTGTTKGQNDASEVSDVEATSEDTSEIIRIKGVWRTQAIEVESGDITPGIKEFALAFCKQYAKYKPNEALQSYLIQPKEYNEEKTGCAIIDEERNGFIASHAMSQYNMNTDCCYWKCDNGHRLVAFWLDDEYENEAASAKLALFYDYDPATDKMTPKPELTDMIENAAKSFDSYEVKLPSEGKDIVLTKFTNADEDSYESTEQLLKWNGQGFDLK